jgi:AraC-like DNA-binding protein
MVESMKKVPDTFEEATTNGPRTKRWVLEASECRELMAHRIARVGIDDAYFPYRRVRCRPEGSFVMACLEGKGRIYLDGRWQNAAAGTVCMAPPRVLNAFAASKGEPWRFAWLRFDEPEPVSPLVGADSPVKLQGGSDLVRAMEGLREEWSGAKDPRMIHHWVELIHGTARRLAQPFRTDERLRGLWQKVQSDVTADWSLKSLAFYAHVSPEHLRRICRKELGRTPMQQVASIRINVARRLLEQTNDKMEVIAQSVGFANAFIFSRVFKRVTGMAPVEYRGRHA